MPKRHLIIFVFCLHCIIANAQNPKGYYLKPNDIPLFKTDYDIPAESESLASAYRIITPDSTEAGMFIVKDYYLDGKIKLIGRSKNNSPDARFDGSCLGFFKNGKRRFIENYKDGNINGDLIKYYPSGKLYITGVYDDKQKFLLTSCYDTTGKAIAENGKGLWIKYDDDLKLIKGKGDVLAGVEEGQWIGNVNDSTTYSCDYTKGEVTSGKSITRSGVEHVFSSELEQAEFKGGLNELGIFLARNVRYPAMARERNVQGKVFVTYTVEVDGTISGLRVLRGIGSGCDEETMRVIALSSGKWKPGTQFGVPVRSQFTVPISFTLADDTKKHE